MNPVRNERIYKVKAARKAKYLQRKYNRLADHPTLQPVCCQSSCCYKPQDLSMTSYLTISVV